MFGLSIQTKRPACILSLKVAIQNDSCSESKLEFPLRVHLEGLRSALDLSDAIRDSLKLVPIPEKWKKRLIDDSKRRCDEVLGDALIQELELESEVRGALPDFLVDSLWDEIQCYQIQSLKLNDAVETLLHRSDLSLFKSLRRLNLSESGISTLPGQISSVPLEFIDISKNRLSILPKGIGNIKCLRYLCAQENILTILPGELSQCIELEHLDLSSNRLSSILISFSEFRKLRYLNLDENPLESFPDISRCIELSNVSFSNVNMWYRENDLGSRTIEVTCSFERKATSNSFVVTLFGPRQSDPLQEFFNLALCGTTHHPLVIGAIRTMVESSSFKQALIKNEQALKKLNLMILSEDTEIVTQACSILGTLAEFDGETANTIIDSHGGLMLSLLEKDKERQMAALHALETLTRFSSSPSRRFSALISWSESILSSNSSIDLVVAVLRVLGNIGQQDEGKTLLMSSSTIMDKIHNNVCSQNRSATDCKNEDILYASIRLLSGLGLHDRIPVHGGLPSVQSRGVRILSLDGGGMKGLATIRLLRDIEKRSNRPLHELFDLVVGTSTGALLAVALMIKGMTLPECEEVYKELGTRVFKNPVDNSENDESWMNVFYRSLHTKTEHVRAVVVGCKHDTGIYEDLLKEKCKIPTLGPYCFDSLLDTCALNIPKVALISTLTSVSPAQPYIFRNYEYSSRSGDINRLGSSSHEIWQAVRASSAAIYYLDEFEFSGNKFQDGALVANNPGLIALQEAHHIWPDAQISLLVSVGTGSGPVSERQKGVSSYIDTGSALLESATNVEEVHKSLMVISSILPGLQYFRLNPVDVRCEMELDCVDPQKWRELELASDEYVEKSQETYEKIAKAMGM
ncbi:hypothetical protein M9435_004582 [Picochlorum sp. BPE23]|nr:hypothetical protein M9435_004582 [Picochlorum sp. BPE23]